MEILDNVYDTYASESKVWIFQADRALTEQEVAELSKSGNEFAIQWKAHGSDLKASCFVLYNHFLVFISDETINKAGGCSIDKLVHFVKNEGDRLNIDFLNRLLIAYRKEEMIALVPISQISQEIRMGVITEDSLVFNNAVTTLDSFKQNWQVELKQSFLKKYLKTEMQE